MNIWAVADLICRCSPADLVCRRSPTYFLFQPEGFVILFFSLRASFEHPWKRGDMQGHYEALRLAWAIWKSPDFFLDDV
jgi:hypothetical protein